MQMAKAGELLVSGTVYDQIHGLLPAGRVAARGNVALRGKSEATPVYAIALAQANPG
jgi:class 3 adenylate cyclase